MGLIELLEDAEQGDQMILETVDGEGEEEKYRGELSDIEWHYDSGQVEANMEYLKPPHSKEDEEIMDKVDGNGEVITAILSNEEEGYEIKLNPMKKKVYARLRHEGDNRDISIEEAHLQPKNYAPTP